VPGPEGQKSRQDEQDSQDSRPVRAQTPRPQSDNPVHPVLLSSSLPASAPPDASAVRHTLRRTAPRPLTWAQAGVTIVPARERHGSAGTAPGAARRGPADPHLAEPPNPHAGCRALPTAASGSLEETLDAAERQRARFPPYPPAPSSSERQAPCGPSPAAASPSVGVPSPRTLPAGAWRAAAARPPKGGASGRLEPRKWLLNECGDAIEFLPDDLQQRRSS
jgi:hypothetical protein